MSRKQVKTQTIPLDMVRYKLAGLWFIGAGIIAALLIVQTLSGHYGTGADAKKYWDWYTPLVAPILLTMIGVLAGSALGSPEAHSVNRNFYWLVYGLSVAYLLMIVAPILAQPISPLHWDALLKDSDYWLTGAKGLVVAAIGYLFASKQKTEDAEAPTKDAAKDSQPAAVD